MNEMIKYVVTYKTALSLRLRRIEVEAPDVECAKISAETVIHDNRLSYHTDEGMNVRKAAVK